MEWWWGDNGEREREEEGVKVRTADLVLTEHTSYNVCLPFSKEILEKLNMDYIG